MLRPALVVLLVVLCLPARAQGAFEGTWAGPLRFPGASLEFVLHVSAADNGGYVGTADSPSQGSYGIPVEVAVRGDTLTATVAAVGARFEGVVEGEALVGTFSQGANRLPTTLERRTEAIAGEAASPLVGDWEGVLGGALPVVLHLRPEGGGGLRATLDSPSQGSFGNAASEARLDGDSLVVTFPGLNGRYDAAARGDSLVGTWSQGQPLPLVLTRAGAGRSEARPSWEPRQPVPYAEEEVRVASRDGVELSGTLVLPEGNGPFPAVVLVSGTGPQDRDEAMGSLKPFAVLADALARRGVASYRYDDRGVGRSTGDFAAATLDDFAADAGAAARAIAARPEVGAVGVVGHSEGAFVAPEVAAETPEVAFVVMLAGAAVSGAEIYAAQHERIVTAGGVAPEAAAVWRGAVEALVAALNVSDAPADDLRPGMVEAFREALDAAPPATLDALGLPDPKATVTAAGQIADFALAPGIRSFLAYDPGRWLEGLDRPALAVFGGLDVQVPLETTGAAMRAALAGVPGSEVVVLDDQNHLFQTATTGGLDEYATAGTPMSPSLTDVVAEWVLQTAGGGAGGTE